METHPLEIEDEPSRQEVQFLEDQINEFNFARTGIRDGNLLACFVRDDARGIIAGIYGWTWGGCCEVRYLWVHGELRGRGYGRRLLLAAEQEARARGCKQMVVETHSFQAPGFYAKYGFEVAGKIEDYPRGEQLLFLKMDLK